MKPITLEQIAHLRFGRLRPVSVGRNENHHRWITCKCDCGNRHEVRWNNLRRGLVESCGCLRRERTSAVHRRHGKTRTKIYRIWSHMLGRCNNESDASFADYGGRGIKACERWLKFENFFADMGDVPPGMTLERVDVNQGYDPGNCCWATAITQANNTRRNRRVVIDGVSKTVAQWAREYSLSQQTLLTRIISGRTGFSALLCPPRNSVPL